MWSVNEKLYLSVAHELFINIYIYIYAIGRALYSTSFTINRRDFLI